MSVPNLFTANSIASIKETVQDWVKNHLYFYDPDTEGNLFLSNFLGKKYITELINKDTGILPDNSETILRQMTTLPWTYNKARQYKGVRGIYIGVRYSEDPIQENPVYLKAIPSSINEAPAQTRVEEDEDDADVTEEHDSDSDEIIGDTTSYILFTSRTPLL